MLADVYGKPDLFFLFPRQGLSVALQLFLIEYQVGGEREGSRRTVERRFLVGL